MALTRNLVFVSLALCLTVSSAVSGQEAMHRLVRRRQKAVTGDSGGNALMMSSATLKELVLQVNSNLANQLSKEKNFVGDTQARYEKAVAYQLEVEAKLTKMLAKAEFCVESSKPAMLAIEQQLATFFEAGDRSGDIEPFKKFLTEAQEFTTSNYALLDSNTAVNRKTLSKLATAIEKKPIPKEKRLNPTEIKALKEQTAAWAEQVNATNKGEGQIVSAMSADISLSNTRSVYHIWHILPEFLPAMRSRATVMPEYKPLHSLSLKLADSCRTEVLSLNQTLNTVRQRRKALEARLSQFIKSYSLNGGVPDSTVLDMVNSMQLETGDMLFAVKTMLDGNPKLVSTPLLRAQAMVSYWKQQLVLRDPNTLPEEAAKAPPFSSADVETDDGGDAAAEADAGVGASAGTSDAEKPKKEVKLVFPANSISRAKKWQAYWQKEVILAGQAEERARLLAQLTAEAIKAEVAQGTPLEQAKEIGTKIAQEQVAALEAPVTPPPPLNSTGINSVLLNGTANGTVGSNETAVKPLPFEKDMKAILANASMRARNKTKGGRMAGSENEKQMKRFNKYLHDWEAKLAAAAPNSNARALAADWVKYFKKKLANKAVPRPKHNPAPAVMKSPSAQELEQLLKIMNSATSSVGATSATGAAGIHGYFYSK